MTPTSDSGLEGRSSGTPVLEPQSGLGTTPLSSVSLLKQVLTQLSYGLTWGQGLAWRREGSRLSGE